MCFSSCPHRLRGLNKLISNGIGSLNKLMSSGIWEAERSPPSGADVKNNVWRCTSVHPSDLIGWCYVNMLQLIQVSLCLPRDKIVKVFGIQWICSPHSQAVFLVCFTLKMNFFRALASAYLVITSRRCHTHRLESKAALVWEPKKIHFSRRFGYLFCYS